MTPAPLVSVIIPCYNAGDCILQTLDSIINQTYTRLEIIIVNDGSTDNSEEKILSVHDSRIRYFKQPNAGQCRASNYGLSMATGAYIKFFDADDVMNAEHIEMQVKKLNGATDKIASSAWGRFYDGNPQSARFVPETVWKNMKPLDWLRAALLQKNDMMGAWLWLLPIEVLNKSGGWDERLSLNNDFEFGIRLLLSCEEVLFVPEAKVYYRSGASHSLSQQPGKKRFEEALLSTQLGCSYLIKIEDSPQFRLICANRFQEWIYRMYPSYPELATAFEAEVKKYGGSNKSLDGGRGLKLLVKLFGWKNALDCKSFIYKLFGAAI
jgi:glycosyltransferase involved in cell wall biosynthesis